MTIHGEDTDMDPEREKFIRSTLSHWEREWVESESRSSGSL